MQAGKLDLSARSLSWLAFFGLVLAAWGGVLALTLPGPEGWSLAELARAVCAMPVDDFATLAAMWLLMMAAMMAPTLAPALATYERLIRSANGSRAGWWGVLAGYGLVWAGGAVGFAALHLGLARAGLVDAMGAAVSGWLAAALLLLAGGYQFSRLKDACHDACLSPFRIYMALWRPGLAGGLRMGAAIGIACVGCCWALMGLAFLGGAMSLLFMALATLVMVLEKLPALGAPLRRPLGLALIGAGIAMGGWTAGAALAAA